MTDEPDSELSQEDIHLILRALRSTENWVYKHALLYQKAIEKGRVLTPLEQETNGMIQRKIQEKRNLIERLERRLK